jgi:hypothetical protein
VDGDDFAEGWRNTPGPTEAHETALGVIDIIEAVEEVQTGVDEGRTSPANQSEIGRGERIGVITECEGVKCLGGILRWNRYCEIRSLYQRGCATSLPEKVVSGTVRYMVVTPVSIKRLPQAAGFAAFTEMQAGVAAQSLPSASGASLT